jgi:hypothetical protein
MRLPKPVIGPITSKFGYRPPLSFHNGQDYGWLYADPDKSRRIYAPIGGKVTVGKNSLVGNHLFLPMGGGWRTRLCHFDSIAVRNGQTVRKGQYLGYMGDTGTQARGVHLHVDVYDPAGIRRNPADHYTNTFVLDQPGFAGGNTTPITTDEEDDMKLIKRADGADEWSLFHPSLRGTDDKQRGYIVTTDPKVARGWARVWADGFGSEKSEPRDVYVEEQAMARITHDAYLRGIPTANQGTAAINVEAITAAINAALVNAIPTAEENGQAARDAIVK